MGRVVIQDKDGNDQYMLKPSGKGNTLCYEVHKWNVGEKHTGWKGLGYYPSSIASGLRMIAGDIQRNQDFELFAKVTPANLEIMGNHLEEILNGFTARLVAELKNGQQV